MKNFVLLAVFAVFFYSCDKKAQVINQEELSLKKATLCKTIQDGTLLDSKGNLIEVGFDKWGYNYQSHTFNGFLGNYSKPTVPVTKGDKLVMKWNDAWLSNKDCDGDEKLDRPLDADKKQYYFGSGAWVTNHMSGEYVSDDEHVCKWTYFCKIVAVPVTAKLREPSTLDSEGNPHLTWYTEDGKVIGQEIWLQFAVTEEIYNDPCEGEHGVLYKSPAGPGLGKFKP